MSALLDQVQTRIESLDPRYAEVGALYKQRKQRLNDQLSALRLQNDPDYIEE